MAIFWTAPTTKHAFRLAWISLVFTILAAFAGILLYSVRFVSPLPIHMHYSWISSTCTSYVLHSI